MFIVFSNGSARPSLFSHATQQSGQVLAWYPGGFRFVDYRLYGLIGVFSACERGAASGEIYTADAAGSLPFQCARALLGNKLISTSRLAPRGFKYVETKRGFVARLPYR